MNQTTTEPAPAPVNRPKTTDKTKPLVLGGVIGALVLSLAACGYCVYDFTRGDAEITFDTTVGNNATTFEGGANITTVAEAVSDSVVSILTETRTTGYWGQDETSAAAGSGWALCRRRPAALSPCGRAAASQVWSAFSAPPPWFRPNYTPGLCEKQREKSGGTLLRSAKTGLWDKDMSRVPA